VLANSGTRLVFLSACQTGVAQGASIFNGIAPGLIEIGIPAVVAMQGSPPDKQSARFAGRFYASLAKGRRVPEAVNDGRRAIYRAKPVSWYMPVTYLRSADESYGQLFTFE
jgi:CHAT domain-containing protein